MNAAGALTLLSKGPNNKISVCPWQEIRLTPHLHWQIDLILSEQELVTFDRFKAGNDLLLLWYGLLDDKDRFYYLTFDHSKAHIAANPQPLYKYFKLTPPIPLTVYEPKPLSSDWLYTIVDTSTDYLVATRGRQDGRFDVSLCQFGKPK